MPVLSEQILVAPPIISQLANYLTKLFSSFIFPTEKARAIDTAKGSPSGTATTTIVTAIKNAFTIYFMDSKQTKQCVPIAIFTPKCIHKANIVNAANKVPIFPISSATYSNFC